MEGTNEPFNFSGYIFYPLLIKLITVDFSTCNNWYISFIFFSNLNTPLRAYLFQDKLSRKIYFFYVYMGTVYVCIYHLW